MAACLVSLCFGGVPHAVQAANVVKVVFVYHFEVYDATRDMIKDCFPAAKFDERYSQGCGILELDL